MSETARQFKNRRRAMLAIKGAALAAALLWGDRSAFPDDSQHSIHISSYKAYRGSAEIKQFKPHYWPAFPGDPYAYSAWRLTRRNIPAIEWKNEPSEADIKTMAEEPQFRDLPLVVGGSRH